MAGWHEPKAEGEGRLELPIDQMINKTYTIKGSAISDAICNFVREHDRSAFESNYNGGFLRVWEEYSYVNRADIMICVRVDTTKAADGIIIIEVISGGDTGSLFTGGLFSRGRRNIRDFGRELQRFCKERNIQLDNE